MAERTARAVVALTVALLAPQGLAAQFASGFEAGALTTTRDGQLPLEAFRFAPHFGYATPRLGVAARVSAVGIGNRTEIGDAGLDLRYATPSFNGLSGEFRGTASQARHEASLAADHAGAEGRLLYSLDSGRSGAWVSAGVERPWRIALISSVDVAGAGGWTRVGGATLRASFLNFFFTRMLSAGDSLDYQSAPDVCRARKQLVAADEPAPAPTPTGCHRYSHFSDLEGALHWELGLVELNARGGLRFGDTDDVTPDSRRWAAASATLWMTGHMAAVLGGGRVPANPARGIPARNFANLGVMFAYAPLPRRIAGAPPRVTAVRAFEARTVAPGVQRIVVRIGGVESVEIMGDFSDWQPLTLVRRGRDLWELTVPMGGGIHQINIRVDGGRWHVPPGLPTSRDGFGGETGLLILQDS